MYRERTTILAAIESPEIRSSASSSQWLGSDCKYEEKRSYDCQIPKTPEFSTTKPYTIATQGNCKMK
jgi:hypothetical protein